MKAVPQDLSIILAYSTRVHTTQHFIILRLPSQKRGLVLHTLEFNEWIADDSDVRLDGDVYDASWMPASLKAIWNDTESGGVLHLTLQLVRRLYTEDSPCGRLLRRCLPRRRTWECLDVLKKYQDWSQCASADVSSGVPWFGAMTAANNSTKHRRLLPQGITYPEGVKRGTKQAADAAFLGTTLYVPKPSRGGGGILRWTWSFLNPRREASECDDDVSSLIDAEVLCFKDASQDVDILVPCASWRGKIARALKRGDSMQELGEALQRAVPRISNERATRLAGWIASHSSDAPPELLEYARVKDVDVVALLRRAVAGCADIAVACARDRMVVERGACVVDDTKKIVVQPASSHPEHHELCDAIRRVVNVIGKKQCAEYGDLAKDWSLRHAHEPSIAWPITDWLMFRAGTVDWSSAEVGVEVERCGMLNEKRAAASGVVMDMWDHAYDASLDARFVGDTHLRANSPSQGPALALPWGS